MCRCWLFRSVVLVLGTPMCCATALEYACTNMLGAICSHRASRCVGGLLLGGFASPTHCVGCLCRHAAVIDQQLCASVTWRGVATSCMACWPSGGCLCCTAPLPPPFRVPEGSVQVPQYLRVWMHHGGPEGVVYVILPLHMFEFSKLSHSTHLHPQTDTSLCQHINLGPLKPVCPDAQEAGNCATAISGCADAVAGLSW
jgi:hypothetical protein